MSNTILTKKNGCFIIAILSIVVIIYLLIDFKKSLQPFTNLEQQLNTLINDDTSGINTALSNLESELANPSFELANFNRSHLDNLKDKIINHQEQRESIDLSSLKIKDLKSQVEDLDLLMTKRGLRDKLNQHHKGIKSLNNGLDVGIEAVDRNKYLVKLNNGCLGINGKDYGIYQCNPKDSNQHFKLQHIFNEYAYGNQATHQDYAEDKKNIKYPFVVAKSVKSNNCITNNHNNIRVMPCNMLKSQRWNTLDKPVCEQ
jgi:hypothetical protein